MTALKKPPQSMRVEGGSMTASTDRTDGLVETGGLEDACGLVNTSGGPAHGSQREPELTVVRCGVGHIAQDDNRQFARGLLAHSRVGGRDPYACPARCIKDCPRNGFVFDSHACIWNI